jgi:hypothetical protein
MIPLYAASASATLLALRAIFHNRAVRLRHANVAWANQDLPGDVSLDAQSAGLFAEAKEHIAKHGGAVIFAFKLARLLGCLVLLGLSLATFVLEEHSRPVSDGLSLFAAVPLDRRPKRKHKTHAHFSYGELLQVAMIVRFVSPLHRGPLPLATTLAPIVLCNIARSGRSHRNTSEESYIRWTYKFSPPHDVLSLCLSRSMALDHIHPYS